MTAAVSGEPPAYVLNIDRQVIEHRDATTGELEASLSVESWIVLQDNTAIMFDGLDLMVGYPAGPMFMTRDPSTARWTGSQPLPSTSRAVIAVEASKSQFLRLFRRTPTELPAIQIIERADNSTAQVDLPIESSDIVTDISFAESESEVFLGTWNGDIHLVSLLDGTTTKSLSTGFRIQHLVFQPSASEFHILDADTSSWNAVSWPAGTIRPSQFHGADISVGTGETPLDHAPPRPWEDADGNGLADWYETKYASLSPACIAGDVDDNGRRGTKDALIMYRADPMNSDPLRFDVNLDGHLDQRDAELLYQFCIGQTDLPNPD
ncbi:hypothetical protein KQI84_06125 [bacterium]|nr:hypothetical protein [bacterium]